MNIRAAIRTGLAALALVATTGYFSSASAVEIPNPVPADFGPDINQQPAARGKFKPDNLVVAVEAVDLGPRAPVPPGPFDGSDFGFFFASDPTTLIEIFDRTEQNPDPGGPASSPPRARIDFAAGEIVNPVGPGPADDILKNVFTPGNGKIGFYLTPDPNLQALVGASPGTIYSIPSLNPAGEDLIGIFPAFAFDKTFLLGFGQGNPVFPYAYHAVVGVTPAPEPGTLLLTVLGILVVVRIASDNGRMSASRHVSKWLAS